MVIERYQIEINDFAQLLPVDERIEADRVFHALQDMQNYVLRFLATVELFGYARQTTTQMMHTFKPELLERAEVTSEWKMIAARDGAMTVYHFAKAIEGMKKSLHKTPTLSQAVDKKHMKEAQRAFSKSFPHWEGIRNAVGHQAELGWTESDYAKNSSTSFENGFESIQITQGSGRILMTDSLFGDTYTTSVFGGQILSYDINEQSLNHLYRALKLFVWAIRSAGRQLSPST